MDLNFQSNRIIAHRSPGDYFVSSPSRQCGSVFDSAINLGLKNFVLPMAKKIDVPSARTFIGAAAPDLLKVLEVSSSSKEAFRSVAKITIRKQLGGGRTGTFRKLYTSKNASHRCVGEPKQTKKRIICKVTGKPFRKRSYRRKKVSGETDRETRSCKEYRFTKKKQPQPVVGCHENLQLSSAAGMVFSLRSLTLHSDSFGIVF